MPVASLNSLAAKKTKSRTPTRRKRVNWKSTMEALRCGGAALVGRPFRFLRGEQARTMVSVRAID